jgi:hypothetical protein
MRETSGSGTRLKFDLGCSPVKRLSCIRERNWVHMLIFAIFLENFGSYIIMSFSKFTKASPIVSVFEVQRPQSLVIMLLWPAAFYLKEFSVLLGVTSVKEADTQVRFFSLDSSTRGINFLADALLYVSAQPLGDAMEGLEIVKSLDSHGPANLNKTTLEAVDKSNEQPEIREWMSAIQQIQHP